MDAASPHGRYGDCGEDANNGYTNCPEPKPIVRMPGRQYAERLSILIHETGCTLAEHTEATKECRIIYGPHDDVMTATRLLASRGYHVSWVKRHTGR